MLLETNRTMKKANEVAEPQHLFDLQPGKRYQDVYLGEFVEKLIAGLQPAAAQQNNFFVNEILPGIILTTNENLLASVITDLLIIVIGRNKNSCIRISAKNFSNIVLLHINEQYSKLTKKPLSDFNNLQPLAAKLGGCITVSGHEESSDTLALSFLDFVHLV